MDVCKPPSVHKTEAPIPFGSIEENSHLMQTRSHLPETDVSQSEEWVAGCLGRRNCYTFVVEELDAPERRVIGLVGAIRTPEVGYMFHPDSWGKGYATEAMVAYMPLLWEHVDPATAPEWRRYDYSEAFTDAENATSRKLLEKLGFTLWEIRRQEFNSPNLGLRDTAVYRIARPGAALDLVAIPSHERVG